MSSYEFKTKNPCRFTVRGAGSANIPTVSGFTLLEVMIALAIIAIALTAALSSGSRGVSLATEAGFRTTAALLARQKMAHIETVELSELVAGTGDFGAEFEGYHWELFVDEGVSFHGHDFLKNLVKIDLLVSWGENARYRYRLRLYRFFTPI
jgi:prepilin-type N-terminal cleavage/methylation domain-containing protein